MSHNYDQQPNQTLAKALSILEAFSVEHPDWGVRELGRNLDINPTTVYRLVSTLYNLGYLERNESTQRYSLGPKVVKLASLYTRQNPISEYARKLFEHYADRFEYNFYLGKLHNDEVVYLAALDGRGPLKIVVEPGGSTALHATALGKVLLAFQDKAYIEEFVATDGLRAYTERSITSPTSLLSQLKVIRSQRYAINDGEYFEDIGAVGVPIVAPSGRVNYGVSLAYPRHIISEQRIRIEDLLPLAHEIADDIAGHVGLPFQGDEV